MSLGGFATIIYSILQQIIAPINSPRLSGTVINSLDASILIMYVNRDSRLSSFITANFE
jgi:hypothetical protein